MTKDLWEITWIGRGGQGAVTASTTLAKAAFLDGYADVQAFPFFGAERRGAPVRAFTRISNNVILDYSQIYVSDIVVLFDYKLLKILNLSDEIKKNGTLVVNSDEISREEFEGNFDVYVIDANKVASELSLIIAGVPIVNTSMLGAFAKATNLVTLNSLLKALEVMWPKQFFKQNSEACKLAYKNCIKVI
ncbi:MAG: 2-oxoacid:acceptor oxidoreductase family protein [Candidatus Odinarchaeia archaeon]